MPIKLLLPGRNLRCLFLFFMNIKFKFFQPLWRIGYVFFAAEFLILNPPNFRLNQSSSTFSFFLFGLSRTKIVSSPILSTQHMFTIYVSPENRHFSLSPTINDSQVFSGKDTITSVILPMFLPSFIFTTFLFFN